jgi:hypothetical protein
LSNWNTDWKNSPKGARIFLTVIAILIILVSLGAAVWNFKSGDYTNAAGFPIAIALIGARFVIWPWRLAWAAARRGGNFTLWLVGEFVAGYVIGGLVYLIVRGRKPLQTDIQASPSCGILLS